MINIAVAGAETPLGGELIRTLVNHPEVEIKYLFANGYEGQTASSIHHGLIGERPLHFCSFSSMDDSIKLLFLCNRWESNQVLGLRQHFPNLKIISFYPIESNDPEFEYDGVGNSTYIFGLPEINRKALVRGAKYAYTPSPAASAILVALFPLALNMLLNDQINIKIAIPDDLSEQAKTITPQEISKVLSRVQRSFTKIQDIEFTKTENQRELTATISLQCSVDMTHILELFKVYDDHSFTFPVTTSIAPRETSGTNKIIVSLRKPTDQTLEIQVVADPRMRGGAGEAIHIMNLMFGLTENTGLMLKASHF